MQDEVEAIHAEDFELPALWIAGDELGWADVNAEGKGIAECAELKFAVKAGGEGLVELGADVERRDRPGDHQREEKEEHGDDEGAKDETLARSFGHGKMIVGTAEIVIGAMSRAGAAVSGRRTMGGTPAVRSQ
jgi:hypothetical protein